MSKEKITTYEEYINNVITARNCSDSYYKLNKSIISDKDYDELMEKIKEYEFIYPQFVVPFSPSLTIGSNIHNKFNKLSHKVKMYSMENAFNKLDITNWCKKFNTSTEFYVEPKFDGCSLNLTYNKGKLISASTRGNGEIGEDVTLNAFQIDNIPKTISHQEEIEIRGEIVISKDDFDKLNDERIKSNLETFSSPRNAASGSLRQLDPKITKERNLKFYPWGIGYNNLDFKKHSEVMLFIKSLGFLSHSFVILCKDIEDIIFHYNELSGLRENENIEMDGMVVRLNDLEECKKSGYTSKYPNYMIAFKFPYTEETSQILSVNFSVGRTGVLTPVANIKPVNILGATVNKCSLHNCNIIKELDVKIGDVIGITRSGDVIPKITKVYDIYRDKNKTMDIEIPEKCPSCHHILHKGEVYLVCLNSNCPDRIISNISYFFSKNCLDVNGLSEKTVKLICNLCNINKAEDFYSLKYEDLKQLEGFKDKKITNLLNDINNSKKTKLWRFINALGINYIGETASKTLASNFDKDWYNKKVNDYLSLTGFGNKMVKSLIDFINTNRNRIEYFYNILEFESDDTISESPILGNVFVITGTLSKPRNEFIKLIESLGGIVRTYISHGKDNDGIICYTDYILYGDNPGSNLEKGKSLGIKCINEEEFLNLINKK